jgi:transposase
MPNNLIAMNKVKQILQWYTEGVPKLQISQKAGVSRNSVKSYIRQFIAMEKSLEEILSMKDAELERLFLLKQVKDLSERQKILFDCFPEIDKALKRKGTTLYGLWKEYHAKHPDGFKHTQFHKYYCQWAKRSHATMHIDHKAGDKMYVDFAGEKLMITDPQTGEIIKVEVFLSILGASQLVYVEAVMSQCKEDFIAACENALLYYGGAPQAIVPDNLKSAVIKSSRYEPTLNESFRDFVEHYRMTALPAAPYKPRHKALVEGAVKLIYQAMYTVLRTRVFASLEQLNKAIWELLSVFNDTPLKGRPYSRRQMFEEVERMVLQPLPAYRYELKNKRVATVARNSHVCLSEDKHYYSVPYPFIGKKVTILYSQSQVDVYYRYEHIASHKRSRRPFLYTTVDDHLASKHKYQAEWSVEKFLERAKTVGEQTEKYIHEILARRQHPEQAYKTCQGILSFASRIGEERLEAACRRANFYGDYSYKTISTILEKRLDHVPLEQEKEPSPLPVHANLRGQIYYS